VQGGAMPFQHVTGRDASADPPPCDIGQWYYDARLSIAEDASLLTALMQAVDWTNDLTSTQWAQWYSVALGFKPDRILELGRGRGNSTAVFCQAMSRLGQGDVVSLCQTGDWASLVAPRLAKIVPASWFSRLDARTTDILSENFDAILSGQQRVLVLWDAHGFEVAEVVLGEILPRVIDRPHLILMHDILDNRHASVPRSYENQPLWKGSKWQNRARAWNCRVNVGWMHGLQDQIIAIADFCARNSLEIGSADHEYDQFFSAHEDHAIEMRRLLGTQLFSLSADFAFFSLYGKHGPFYFPAVEGRQAFEHSCGLTIAEPLPESILTSPRSWQYAAVFAWRPAVDVPPGVRSWMRLRLQVDGGAIGVGLLSPDGLSFAERRAVSPSAGPVTVLLPVADSRAPGRLVIQTWELPETASVRIQDLALLW
jgi:hypothetical protein